MQGLQDETAGGLSYVGARLDIFGPLQAMQRAVNTIEDAKPYLFVTSSILKRALQPPMPGSVAAEPVIDAQLDVYAAFRQDGAP